MREIFERMMALVFWGSWTLIGGCGFYIAVHFFVRRSLPPGLRFEPENVLIVFAAGLIGLAACWVLQGRKPWDKKGAKESE